jgi:DNA polymerase-3 subunit chi
VTQIDFYTHVGDKWHTACRLAAKAYARGLRVAVLCPDAESAQRLDRLLWTNSSIGFIPHCHATHALAPRTPVTITHEDGEPPHDEVLLNLRESWPPMFSRFQRLIEIVSTDDNDRASARDRFKFYRDRGYDIRSHDLSKTES